MEAFRFITKVSDKGTIQLPHTPALFEREVEIIIIPKRTDGKKKMKGAEFVKKWGGFLAGADVDQARYDYLSEKYK